MTMKIVSSLFPLLSLLHGAVVQAQFSYIDDGAGPLGNLKQLHVITRHGARLPLYKDPNTLAEHPEGPPLTPTGEKELYDLGLWLQKRYESTRFGQTVFARFNSSHALLESSALDRTITSANALALGLFNATARDPFNESKLPTGTMRPNVPVFMLELENDVYLRGYDKCHSFHERLEDLYANDSEWKALEEQFGTLRTKLATLDLFSEYVEGSQVPLKALYNVFDTVFVKRSECGVQSATFDSISEEHLAQDLSSDELAELQSASYQAEMLKYSRKTAGSDVSGNLLQKIVNRMATVAPHSAPRFFLYSAHYPTLLGLMAALNKEPYDNKVIPSYGSALLIEVYEKPTDGGDLMVQMHFKPGNYDQMSTLEQSCMDQNSSECALYKELSMFASNYNVQDWCVQCENSVADICQPEIIEPSCNSSTESSTKTSQAALAGALIGLIGGAMLTLIGCWCWKRRVQRKAGFANASVDKTQTTETEQRLAEVSREEAENDGITSSFA